MMIESHPCSDCRQCKMTLRCCCCCCCCYGLADFCCRAYWTFGIVEDFCCRACWTFGFGETAWSPKWRWSGPLSVASFADHSDFVWYCRYAQSLELIAAVQLMEKGLGSLAPDSQKVLASFSSRPFVSSIRDLRQDLETPE
jgi:hypothetical protein